MKLYVAMGGWNNSDGFEEPIGVFSTVELAQAAIYKVHKQARFDIINIQEYELDKIKRAGFDG